MFSQLPHKIIISVVSILVSIYAIYLLDQYSYQQKRIKIQEITASHASHITHDLNQTLSAAYPIAALIRAQNGNVSGFTELATEMLPLYPAIASLQLLPDGVVKHIVPIEGNENALGHNLFLDPERSNEAHIAKVSGKLTLAGPFDLRQGGIGAASRLPIYLDTADGKKFWGFAAVLIRFPDILNTTHLSTLAKSGVGYQLSRVLPGTNETQIIATSNTTFSSDTVTFDIPIPNGNWTLRAYPIDGWRNYPRLFLGSALALVFIFLATFATTLWTRLAKSRALLEAKVKERTSELEGNLAQLAESERKLVLSQQVGGIGTWEWDLTTDIIFWSDQISELFGRVQGLSATTIEDFLKCIHPDDLEYVLKVIYTCIESGESYDIDYRVVSPEGHISWLNEKANVIRDDNRKAITILGVSIDITKRKNIENKLFLSSRVFSDAHDGITITDSNKLIVDVNPAFTRITGYTRDEVIGKNPRILSSGKQSAEFYRDMWQNISEHGHWQGEIWNRKKCGEIYPELLTITVIKDSNNTLNYLGVFTDITHIKRQQKQLKHIAHYDLLTNLPNKVLLTDRLSQAILRCDRNKNSLAVVCLDLDNFTDVNDIHGHDIGDELLIEFSVRLKEALREGDSLARVSGDEFIAVLVGLTQIEDCEPILERLLLAVSNTVTIRDIVFNMSISIGVTLYPQDNVDGDLLIRHANQAMYRAKELGKNRYHLFDTAQDEAVKAQRENLEDIRNALDNQQFVLYYQPKVNMKTGIVIGVEALIRWQHPERGLLSPIEFLPVIENNPMSYEMGEWVIDTALSQISEWQRTGLNLPVGISVNITAAHLQHPNFSKMLAQKLAAHPEVDPHYLELEVLETSALDNIKDVTSIMNVCIGLGVNFALDDFGTGYSSLTYLRRLPANLIKIDQSFVRDMLLDTDDLAIIEGVIALAKSFKREVIAEGVETKEHGSALLQLGCELAQGYGIAKPMPAEQIPAWIISWVPDKSWTQQL